MASRVIRDGLLDSEPVAALHDRTFRLFVGLILSADDYGLVELGYGPIKRAHGMLDWPREMVAKMLGELTDARLILPYEHQGRRYAAIAKWAAHINTVRPKHPLPSWGTEHVRSVLGFKSANVRVASSHYFKHLGFDRGPPVPPKAPPSGTHRAPIGNEEVRGKREEIKNIRGAKTVSESFEAFWEIWPRHQRKADKAKCIKAWNASNLDERLPEITANVQAWKVSQSWSDQQFIPAPLVYLHRKTYDAPTPAPKGGNGMHPQALQQSSTIKTSFGAFDTSGLLDANGHPKGDAQ